MKERKLHRGFSVAALVVLVLLALTLWPAHLKAAVGAPQAPGLAEAKKALPSLSVPFIENRKGAPRED